MKNFLSVLAGVIAGFIVVFIGDATCEKLYPVPPGIDLSNKLVMLTYVSTIPIYVLVIMVLFWLFSSFVGGLLAARINRPQWKRSCLITGGILLAAAVLNMAMIPHPMWMLVTALIGYIPAAFFGGYLVRDKTLATTPQ